MLAKEQLEVLQEVYSKENLDKGLFFLVRKFFAQHPFQSWDGVNGQNIVSLLNSKKTFNKTEMMMVSFAVFQNESILKAFLQSLPPAVYKLIGKLLFQQEIGDSEASAFLNEKIVKESSYDAELKREFYFFTAKMFRQYISYATSHTFFTLSLHPILKNLLLNYFPKPLYYNLIPIDEIPAPDFKFNAEPLIHQELPRLLSYQMQQNIKYNSSGRPADATLSKMQRVCTITEFYATDDADISKVRSMLMAGIVYRYSFNALTSNNADVIKDIFNNHHFKVNSPVFILQHLKGWQHFHSSAFHTNAEKKLQDVFRLIPIGKWLSFDNLLEYLNTRTIDIKPVTVSSAISHLTYDGMYTRGSIRIPEKKVVDYKTYEPMVKKAFVAGSVYLYAAFGLMEVAYNNVNTDILGDTYYSPYDGLRHVRLTPLGAYVLGITEKYEMVNFENANKLTFDEDSLIILGEGNLEVINVTLANYAERLATNRFRVTNANFLKDCKNYKDVSNKIALFKKTVGSKLPVKWENYFTELLTNAKAVKEKPSTLVFQLPENSKELHRCIAQDSVLKQLVLKAESYHILVENTNATKFKSRMKELGYMVE
jgi:hypothetical protein